MHHVYGKRGKTAVNKNVLIRWEKTNLCLFFFLLFIRGKNNKNPKQIINFK